MSVRRVVIVLEGDHYVIKALRDGKWVNVGTAKELEEAEYIGSTLLTT